MSKTKPIKVFIGWDAVETRNYDVCVYSIRKHATVPVEIIPLIQKQLRNANFYNRPVDTKASNEFSITRFLTPFLAGHKGHALFIDCDMLITRCIGEILNYANPDHAITVVKHDYIPKESSKFLGQKQEPYPRKNWSSVCMWNCGHALAKAMTPEIVNKSTPAFLHRFEAFPNETIGAFPLEMNWLVGEYGIMENKLPFNLHYTLGSPQFEGYENTEYADIWNQYEQEVLNSKIKNKNVIVHKNMKEYLSKVAIREKTRNGGCGCG